VTRQQADALIDAVRVWLEGRSDLRALALAGSWARGNPKPTSDLDLIIVASDPEKYRFPDEWLRDIPFATATFEIDRYATCTYGEVWSCRVFLRPDSEVELTFAAPGWADIDPLDPGTKFVVADAFRIIIDKDGALQRVFAVVQAGGVPKD
jgi:predicted nucleotidyltransferase